MNMDLVTDVWVNRGQVTVFFAAPAMYSAAPFHGVTNAVSTREVSFQGAHAAALIRWLEKRAKDITPVSWLPSSSAVLLRCMTKGARTGLCRHHCTWACPHSESAQRLLRP